MDGKVVGNLGQGDMVIAVNYLTRVVDGDATTYIHVIAAGMDAPAQPEGWTVYKFSTLERYLPAENIPTMQAPGYPNVSFDLLWGTLIKIGFPILAVSPRARAVDMVGSVLAR